MVAINEIELYKLYKQLVHNDLSQTSIMHLYIANDERTIYIQHFTYLYVEL